MAGGDVRQIGRILSRWVFGGLFVAFIVFLALPNLRRSLLLKHLERRGIYAYHEVDDITLFVLPTDRIETVLIQSEQAHDDDLVAAFRLNPSGSLIFEKTQITDAQAAHLKLARNARSLWLKSARMSDDGLSRLSELTGLRQLHIESLPISEAGLTHVGKLSQLERLTLKSTSISDTGLSRLAGLSNLKELWLESVAISDAGLAQLPPLAKLEELKLTDFPRVSDAGLASLPDMPNLKYLYCEGVPMTSLSVLHLDHTAVTDAGLRELEALTKLILVSLHGTQVSDAAIARITQALPACNVEGPRPSQYSRGGRR
jgi:Leucine-rich repeat (LRR) protein